MVSYYTILPVVQSFKSSEKVVLHTVKGEERTGDEKRDGEREGGLEIIAALLCEPRN